MKKQTVIEMKELTIAEIEAVSAGAISGTEVGVFGVGLAVSVGIGTALDPPGMIVGGLTFAGAYGGTRFIQYLVR